ncbi:MAG: CDP-diacylglycerol--serine O-phosphatidyltransferase [Candidatus Omnitrophica bacterium]|nr:CDP-diacylglycerol--serine O-phosphatidyltransferase [Candidatus Omnitrophota bacterium]
MQHACWVILLALILDGLDGMIAVLTRSCTKFGIQYDSLADLISFGVAPAMLLIGEYRLVEGEQGPVTREYWAMSVVLVVCVALRLARYNVQAYNSEKKSFQGLPCPSPAAFIALLLLCSHEYGFALPPRALMVVVICLGMLMVSSIPYPSLRKSDFFQTQPLSTFALVVLVFCPDRHGSGRGAVYPDCWIYPVRAGQPAGSLSYQPKARRTGRIREKPPLATHSLSPRIACSLAPGRNTFLFPNRHPRESGSMASEQFSGFPLCGNGATGMTAFVWISRFLPRHPRSLIRHSLSLIRHPFP